MTQQNFVNRRLQLWDKIEGVVNGGRKEIKIQAAWFPKAFRELTQDLNTARAHGFDPALIERLNRLVLEGNQLLYGQRSFSFRKFSDFVLNTFPCAIRDSWKGIAIAHLIFYGIIFFTIALCLQFPDFVYEVIPENMARELEIMYNPESMHFLIPRNVSSDADMFGFYIYNNISIAFRTFAGGIIIGVGSLFILSFNALFLGAATAHIINKGFSETFFPFIIGHGSFELSAIIICAYAGLILGYRLFVTKGLTRQASLRIAGKTALPLITGSVILLVIAAVIEAFWSSKHQIPITIRYSMGAAGWLLLYLYFIFMGRKHDRIS
ncbi:MAG: stage II sporulation protein M [Spirochaetaceae bacterium]|nr:stage II sporulation protein M [Spirochaetaceae bacterium]